MKKEHHNDHVCTWPGCNSHKASKHFIDVTRKSNYNKYIFLCEQHKSMIFHPKAEKGPHSLMYEDSLEVLKKHYDSYGEGVVFRNPRTGEEIISYSSLNIRQAI